MDLWVWGYTDEHGLFLIDDDWNDVEYLATVYPDAIYFGAGVAPIPEV